jgi:hypothetical protein
MNRNISGNAYALTLLCPIRPEFEQNRLYADLIRDQLELWNIQAVSPLSKVPNTYLCRFFVLDDIYTESLPGASIWDSLPDIRILQSNKQRLKALPYTDHLQSRYLVFSSNLHGDVDAYLLGITCRLRSRPSGNIVMVLKVLVTRQASWPMPISAAWMRLYFLWARMTTPWPISSRRCTSSNSSHFSRKKRKIIQHPN